MRRIDPDLSGYFVTGGSGGRARIDPELPKDLFKLLTASVAAQSPREPRSTPTQASALQPTRSPRPKTLRSGALIDKYRVEQVLGIGGFAVVYRATHLLLGTPVAIKLLRSDVLAARPSREGDLVTEARFAARINHPNVVRIYDVASSPELSYIVMEFIEGVPLSKRLSVSGALPLDAVIRLGIDVAQGLSAGLQQGLIHRDIKPANVLMGRDGVARIVDFGMAYPSDCLEFSEDLPTGGVVGTRGYMAPEQAVDSSRIDFRADIYSLGVTLEEAAFGRTRLERARLGARSPNLLPRRLQDLLRWMQRSDSSARPASYERIIDELASLRADLAAAEAG